MRKPTRRGLLAGLAVATAGCAGNLRSAETETTATSSASTTDSRTSTEPSTGETASVGMSCDSDSGEYVFRPDLLHVDPGTTVVFGVTSVCRQRTVAYHPSNDRPLRIPEAADPWGSDVVQRSGTFEYRFEVEGVYDYFGLHESTGQVGSVVVGTPDADGQPGLEPPQESLPDSARTAIRDLNRRTRELPDVDA